LTLQDLGNIGEFTAAIVTLATLIYLAVQLRNSNSIASWEAHRSSVSAFNTAVQEIVGTDGTARIFRMGLIDLEQLNEVERIRLHFLLIQMLLNFKDVLEARDKGIYDEQTYEAWEGFICSIFNMPGGEIWWKENKMSFIERVRQAIDAARPEVPRNDEMSPTFWMTDTAGSEIRPSKRDAWGKK
jgi:hypothetical protein